MNTKHTFWTLCKEYDKIEIPILQRDYAQGRKNEEVSRIRVSFTSFLIQALQTNAPVELDFIYGSVTTIEGQSENKRQVFIPLDGQQRLTTLFLLYWYIAAKENRLTDDNTKEMLSRFTYETRPSSHKFCHYLIQKQSFAKELCADIRNQSWYDPEWEHDSSVNGMLCMLDTFNLSDTLNELPYGTWDRLTDNGNKLISFYFIPLDNFGLTENLYIRMNARGKILTPFENFKAEFYKIIIGQDQLAEEFKNKIEYEWTNYFWPYRGENKYTIDNPFMSYLSFISEMLYFKDATARDEKGYVKFDDPNSLSFFELDRIYKNENNLKFLIFALNSLPDLVKLTQVILWNDTKSINQIIYSLLKNENGKIDVIHRILLYASLRYYYKKKEFDDNFYDYIRVLRNLWANTVDTSRREWPKLFKVIDGLITDNIYQTLAEENAKTLLEGFYQSQRNEEILKAKIVLNHPLAKEALINAENLPTFEGNIRALLRGIYGKNTKEIANLKLSELDPVIFNRKRFGKLVESYKIISKDDFNGIWGDMLITSLYTTSEWRMVYDLNWPKNSAIIEMALLYMKRGLEQRIPIEDFAITIEKEYICSLNKRENDLSMVRKVNEQLYIYYILTARIMKKDTAKSFFKKDGYNFGWLASCKGFSSIFKNGIEMNEHYINKNPIYQTYKAYFQYNKGILPERALDAEIVGAGRKLNPFELLLKWANEE